MADTVTTQTIADTSGVKFVAKLTNFSDGTGETLVKKVDASELTFMTEDGNRKISKIWYSVNTANPKSCRRVNMGRCYKCHNNVFKWSKSF